MPAIVLLGAQWGDEGKGKATDLLGSSRRLRRQVQRRQQRRPHHRHRRREVRPAPAARGILTPGVHAGDRQRRRRRPRGAVPARSTRSSARGVDTSRARRSAPTRTSSRRYHRTIDKVTERFLGKRQDRHHRPRHRPDVRRQDEPRRHPRRRTCSTRRSCAQKVEGALELKNHLLVKVYNRRAITVDEVVEELLSYAERLRPMVADTALLLNQALDAARRCCSRAARRRCSTSTTAPIRSSRRPTRPPAAPAPAPASRRPASTGSSRVVKAYTTRVGSGPFPTELLDADGEQLRDDGGEFGTTTGRAAPLRLVRRRRSPATPRGSTASPTSCSPSSTC